ncbi:hypothetical protein BDW22DRAFT_379985 [Trametopsis cervina]|nr:hypothetical protein BDW22DRAFT_379985 [Trametopsis cervina]
MSSGTGANSRVLSPTSLSSSFHYVTASERHSADANDSSEDSFGSISDVSTSDDDEIVWSISDLSSAGNPRQPAALRSPDILSDEEYIVLSPPLSQPRGANSSSSSSAGSVTDSGVEEWSVGLSDVMSNLNIDDSDLDSVRPISQASSTRRRRRRAGRTSAAVSTTAPFAAPVPPVTTPKPKRKNSKAKVSSAPAAVPGASAPKSKKKPKAAKARPTPARVAPETTAKAGLGERPILDDVSEAGTEKTAAYDEAVEYVSTSVTHFISGCESHQCLYLSFRVLSATVPEAKAKSNLTFLQALIVELGLLTIHSTSPDQSFYHLPSLPRSMKAAKALLKSNVFLNVRDYLDVRGRGLDALRNVMHPSRKALIKDLSRGKGQRKVPRDYVKNTGLGVLLVTCYH